MSRYGVGWLYLDACGHTGWVELRQAAISRRRRALDIEVAPGRAFARVRASPSLGGSVLSEIRPGPRFAFLRVSDNGCWFEVQLDSTRTGWVARALVHPDIVPQ